MKFIIYLTLSVLLAYGLFTLILGIWSLIDPNAIFMGMKIGTNPAQAIVTGVFMGSIISLMSIFVMILIKEL